MEGGTMMPANAAENVEAVKNPVDYPPTEKEDFTNNKVISLFLLLLILFGVVTIVFLFIYSGTDNIATTYNGDFPDRYATSSNATPSQTTMTVTTAVPTVTPTTSTKTPIATSSTTPSMPLSTTTSTTPRATSTTRNTTNTTPGTTGSTTSPLSTTTNTSVTQGTVHFNTTHSFLGGSSGLSYTTLSPTIPTTTAVLIVTPRTSSTAPGATPSTMTSTMPKKTPSRQSTTSSTKSSTRAAAPSATTISTSPKATAASTTASPIKPMKPYTILCTFGNEIDSDTVGPKDGICDIIIFDFLYGKGRGTFLNHKTTPLEWFLNYVRNNKGTTEFGMAIDNSNAGSATSDLNNPKVEVAVQHFWSLKIRHYGLLHFHVHNALGTTRSTTTDYIDLFKKLRELQEMNRAGKFDEPGYLILGIGLYAPQYGAVHGYLKEILETVPIDGVVIRTHLDHAPQSLEGCKITGPNVYSNPFNKYEVSMVDALDYVQTYYDMFKGHSLMVSFSMSLLFARPSERTSADGYQIGRNCENIQFRSTYALCSSGKYNYFGKIINPQRVMHGIDRTEFKTCTYDNPATIKWKMCMSTKRYSTLQFGVALFSLEHEDGRRSCAQQGIFPIMAGYWRVEEVSRYMKTVIMDPEYLTKNSTC